MIYNKTFSNNTIKLSFLNNIPSKPANRFHKWSVKN